MPNRTRPNPNERQVFPLFPRAPRATFRYPPTALGPVVA